MQKQTRGVGTKLGNLKTTPENVTLDIMVHKQLPVKSVFAS